MTNTAGPAPTLHRRARRPLALLGTAVLLLASIACNPFAPAAPTPTPDPFAGLEDRARQAFDEGLRAFEEGRFRDAVNAFERARNLSPTTDPRIEQMIERSRAALLPSPTPTSTVGPGTPTSTPVFLNRATPDSDLGQRYFGQVFLTMVPGRNTTPPPVNEFYIEDQVGLYIEALDERLRLPFTLRVFNLDTGELIANARNEGAPPAAGGAPASGSTAATATPARAASPAAAGGTPGPNTSPTPGPSDAKIVRFWNNFIWYREGGERAGRYRAELYQNGTMTHAFDYVVGTVPVALPAPLVPELGPDLLLATPGPDLGPAPEPAPPADVQPAAGKPDLAPSDSAAGNGAGAAGGGGSGAGAAAPPPPPPPPPPTPTPTPAPAASTVIGGLPAGLDVNETTNQVYVADASGVVWTVDRGRPTLDRPFNLDRLPVDVAVDQATGNVWVAARSEASLVSLDGRTGQRLATIPLPVNPGDLQINPELRRLYVVLPERQAVAVLDLNTLGIIRTITGLPQVTGLAVDRGTGSVFLSHLPGQVSILDGGNGQLTARLGISSAGLADIAAGGGRAFAVNTATREFLVIDPGTRETSSYTLLEEPGAVVVGQQTGTVYVLGTRTNSIIRLDPTTGFELGRVLLPDRSGRFGIKIQQQQDFQGLRARMGINEADETVYVTQPEAGTLSIAPEFLFPTLASGPSTTERLAGAAPPPVMASVPTAIRPSGPPTSASRPVIGLARPAAATPMRALAGATATRGPGDRTLALAPAPPAATAAPPPPAPAPLPTSLVEMALAAATPVVAPPAAPARNARAVVAAPAPLAMEPEAPGLSVVAEAAGPPADWDTPDGRFYTQAAGPGGELTRSGFALSDSGGIALWDGFQTAGGPAAWGFPISQRFQWNGYVVQLTQRGLLQWEPSTTSTVFVNLMDELHDEGLDERLMAERQIPKQMSYEAEAGLDFEQVKARRLALLQADPAIAERYFASADPLTEFGLPTSRVVDMGETLAMRTQRGVLQRWKKPMPWARAGDVTTVFAGDLARDFGLFGPLNSQPFTPTRDVNVELPPRVAALRLEEL